ITENRMTPVLKSGDIPGAMEIGTDALIQQLRASPEEAKARTDAAIKTFDATHRARQSGGTGIPFALIFWLIVFVFIMLSRFRGGARGRHYGGSGIVNAILWGSLLNGGGGGWGGGGSSWGGGSDSSGGGFSGGGGGSFGGGGASGSW
ncbi:MAG: methanol dehydrogenase, partial [Pseudomonadota bacterium]|nr:methanol dehydrogenase [Pseudomonadota bacterium]